MDTGNVHLCDILQIPSLVFISKLAAFRFSGGSYKGKYDSLVVDKGWQKNYRKVFNTFSQKAFLQIKNLN